MTKLERKLLDILSRSNTPISGNNLGKQLGISSRTIRNYVKKVNTSQQVIQSSRNGYLLINKEYINKNTIPTDDEERFSLIIKELLANKKINTFNFCDQNYISYSTLQRTISYGNNILKEWNLSVSIMHQLLRLNGNESNKRNFFIHLLYQENSNTFISENQLQNFFDQQVLLTIENILDEYLHRFNIDINTFAYDNLLLYTLLITARSHNHDCKDKISLDINKCTQAIVKKIEKRFNLIITSSDQFLLNTLIENNSHPQGNDTEKIKINSKIYQLVIEIEKHYAISLNKKDFYLPFATHIEKLIKRENKDLHIRNPFTITFKNKMPLVFDMASYTAHLIEKEWKIDVSEDEITFLAMHLSSAIRQNQEENIRLSALLIAPNYLDYQERAQKYLDINFGNAINVLHIITPQQIKNFNLRNYDVIFNTTESKSINSNEIYLNLFEVQSSLVNIKQSLHKLIIKKEIRILKPEVRKYFKKNLFWNIKNSENYKSILHLTTNAMIKYDGIEKDLLKKLIKREKISSTAFNNIAIPHPINYSSDRTLISVVIARKPIQWKQNKANFVFVISAASTDRKIFQKLYELIIELLEDKQRQQKLLKTSNINSFFNTLFNEVYE